MRDTLEKDTEPLGAKTKKVVIKWKEGTATDVSEVAGRPIEFESQDGTSKVFFAPFPEYSFIVSAGTPVQKTLRSNLKERATYSFTAERVGSAAKGVTTDTIQGQIDIDPGRP
jgi:hypothetical protein